MKNSKYQKVIEVYGNQKDTFERDEKYKNMGFSTRAIHAGNDANPIHGGVVEPIDLSTTYAQPAPGKLSACYDYTRCGNPTVMALQRNLASLEQTKYALAFNSGLSATICVLSMLKQGDHLLCIDDVYGGTQRYLRQCFTPQTAIEWDMVDMSDLKRVKAAIKKNTKIVWIESPTNPTLKCTDIAEVAKLCKAKGVLLAIDNTFMSPVLQVSIVLRNSISYFKISDFLADDIITSSFQYFKS